MFAALLLLAGCPMGGGCSDVYGPEGLMVDFTVPGDGDYAWTITGETASMTCTLALANGQGGIDCEGSSFGYDGPEAAEGGGYTFGTFLDTEDHDASVHVTMTQDGTSVLDTDFAPDWQPAEEKGDCADYYGASESFDLRGGDTGDTGG